METKNKYYNENFRKIRDFQKVILLLKLPHAHGNFFGEFLAYTDYAICRSKAAGN